MIIYRFSNRYITNYILDIDMTSFDTTRYINGPINVVRVQGEIDGKKKVMHIFFDTHVYRSKCKEDYSLDIDKFLIREFDRLDGNGIVYDFYQEYPINLYHEPELRYGDVKSTLSYMDDLALTFFSKIDLKDGLDIMKIKRSGNNLRLHLIDIRMTLISNLVNMFSELKYHINKANLQSALSIINIIKNTLEYLESFHNDIKNPNSTKESLIQYLKDISASNKTNNNMEINLFVRMLWKTYHVYKHDKVKTIIKRQLDGLFSQIRNVIKGLNDLTKNIEKHINDSYEYINKNSDKICEIHGCIYGIRDSYNLEASSKFLRIIEDLDTIFMDVAAEMIDLYTLRRFLDKDYTSHGIFYGGSFHSVDLIYHLVKYFEFKVTHYYTLNGVNDVSQINKIIKSAKNLDPVINMFDTGPKVQCVNMNGFPNDFK